MITLKQHPVTVRPLPVSIPAGTLRWLLHGLIFVSACVLVGCLIFRESASWRHWGDLNPTSDVWIATAHDAVHGELYRPLVSDVGYGGTRYAPLRTLLQAGLMKLGMDPVHSAFALSLGGTIALLAALYALMRRLGTPGRWAAILTCFLLSSNGVRTSVLEGLADPLAAFLNVAGLIAITFIAERDGRSSKFPAVLIAATCFALAITTKVTSVFGIGAGLVFLFATGKRRQALLLAAICGVFVLSTIAVVQWASGGRMISVFRACATAGGGLRGILTGPLVFGNMLLRLDRAAGGFWLIAIAMILVARRWTELPVLLMAGTTVVTMAILSTPGTDINHLIDLEVASVLCIASWRNFRGIAMAAASMLMAAIVLYVSYRMMAESQRINEVDHRQQVLRTVEDVTKACGSGPLMCNDPLVPILCGERPYFLDGFMFHVLVEKNPTLGNKLWSDLKERKFRSVILMTSSTGKLGLRTPGHFAVDVVDHVEANYRAAGSEGGYFRFEPVAPMRK